MCWSDISFIAFVTTGCGPMKRRDGITNDLFITFLRVIARPRYFSSFVSWYLAQAQRRILGVTVDVDVTGPPSFCMRAYFTDEVKAIFPPALRAVMDLRSIPVRINMEPTPGSCLTGAQGWPKKAFRSKLRSNSSASSTRTSFAILLISSPIIRHLLSPGTFCIIRALSNRPAGFPDVGNRHMIYRNTDDAAGKRPFLFPD